MGKVDVTNQAAPVTPSSGVTSVYVDSTSKKLSTKDDSGTVTEYSAGSSTDWTLSGQGTIHASNYVDNDTVYTHPNHSGEVTSTGDGVQALASTSISNKTSVTAASTDTVLIGDSSDSNNLKKVTAQSIADLITGGNSYTNPVDTNWKLQFEEFNWENPLTSGPNGSMGLYLKSAGTGPTIARGDLTTTNRVGLHKFGCGSSAGSYSLVSTGSDGVLLGGSEVRVGAAFKFNAIPDATDDYEFFFGLTDDWSNTNQNYGAFRINRGLSTTNFYISTRDSGGTRSDINTGIALDTSWHNFEIIYASDSTYIRYYIDGALVGTESTVFPDAASNYMSLTFEQQNTAGIAQTAYCDWMYLAFKPTVARGAITSWIT